ncbi:cystin-1 [Hemicordylus capensis]|uniref:cystin-1 n=1 Tax=Hemicordylus capensis TaxID=884348 RepID=UPI002303D8AB|nr:cystin-1 [Hemicordylus capensis]
MGTGSSRARKTRSCSCSPPRPWRRSPRWGSGSSSAPAGQEKEAAALRAPCHQAPEDTSLPPPPPGEPDSVLEELVDQLLEECRDEGLPRLSLAASRHPARLAGDCRPSLAGGPGAGDGVHRDQQDSFTRSTPESSNFANQLPLKKPERQAKIAYDYSEEELMATIEQEYCR